MPSNNIGHNIYINIFNDYKMALGAWVKGSNLKDSGLGPLSQVPCGQEGNCPIGFPVKRVPTEKHASKSPTRGSGLPLPTLARDHEQRSPA